YEGPESGPYVFTGATYVQDNLAPLAPLVAGYGQSKDYNRIKRKAIREMMRYERLKGVSGGAQSLLEALKKGAESGIIALQSVDDVAKIADIEKGGLSDQFMVMLDMLQTGVDRNTTWSDTRRSIASGGKT